jgi:hypothetical protein
LKREIFFLFLIGVVALLCLPLWVR